MSDCLHCKISLLIIEHFRTQQGLSADAYPHLGNEEVPEILANVAQVVADTITPCEEGAEQMLRRVGIFAAKVIRLANEDLQRGGRAEGVRLQ
jgi:hypothetical protein